MVDPCDDEIKHEAVPAQVGAPQEPVPCDVETVLPIPDELREPTGELKPEEPLLVPGPLEILSLPVEVPCQEDDTYGEVVSFPMGHKKQLLYFSAILSLDEKVLDFIARRKLESEISFLLNAHSITEGELHSMTGMLHSEAIALIEQANYIQEQLTAAVRAEAIGLLKCHWNSHRVHVECPDPEMAHPEDAKDAVFEVDLPEGAVQSFVSQDDADRTAQLQAEALLNCFYLSDPFTARCEERPGRPLDVMDPVPNDKTPLYPGRSLRVGVVEVPAGAYRSTFSKEDANARAREWGYSQLVCWYPNDPVELRCEDPNARDVHVDPTKEPAHDADIENRKVGQHVYIPRGYFTSELDEDYATKEAEYLAQALLQCCFINRAIDIYCTAQEVYLPDRTTVWVEPSREYSPMFEVHVEAGEYTSCVSQAEADGFAELMVEGMLSCMYCNLPIMPSCVPSWVAEGAANGTIDIPLVEGQIKDENHPEGVSPSSFPLNSTRGTPECTIISSNAQAAQQMGELLGALPVVGVSGDMCTYYNDEIIVACAASDPYSGQTSGKMEQEGYWSVTPDGDPYYFYSVYPPDTCLYEHMTIPLPGQYVRVKVGMFAGQGEDQKDVVNQRAIIYAMSMLQCWFANPPTSAYCNSEELAQSLCDEEWSFGDPTLVGGPEDMLQDWSNSAERPITIPEGQIVITGVTESAAYSFIYEYTRALIIAQILCVYGNEEVESGCSNNFYYKGATMGGPTVCGELRSSVQSTNRLVIPEKTFGAPTVDQATALAQEILYNINFCSSDDYIVYHYCQENPDYDIPAPPEPPNPPQRFSSWSSSSPSSSEPWTPPVECELCFDVMFTEEGEPRVLNVRVCGTGESPGTGFVITEGQGKYKEGDTAKITVSMDKTEPAGCAGCYAHCKGTKTVIVHLGGAGGKISYTSSEPDIIPPVPDESSSERLSSLSSLSSRSSAIPSGMEGCYQQCPNYKAAQQQEAPQTTAAFQVLTNEFTLWENDVAYVYEALIDELRRLEKQMQELMEQL